MALGEKRGASTEDSEVVEVETETAIQTFERESMRISTTPAPSNDDLGVVTPKCSNEKIRENHLRPLAVASNENDAGAQANTSMEGDVATELTPESKPTKKHKTYVEVSFEEEAVGRGERKRVTTVSAETFCFFSPYFCDCSSSPKAAVPNETQSSRSFLVSQSSVHESQVFCFLLFFLLF